MMEIYAYLKGDKEKVDRLLSGDRSLEKDIAQPLSEHIELALSAINELKNSKIWQFYIRLFRFDDTIVEKWLKFAIIFHDFGKIYYQKNFRIRNNEKYLNFKGHEYFSTFLADEFMEVWLEDDVENRFNEYRNFRLLVCASVLYHHHAMGLKSRSYPQNIRFYDENGFREIAIKSYRLLQKFLHDFEDFSDRVITAFVNKLKNLKVISRSENKESPMIDQAFISGIVTYIEDLNVRIWEKFVSDQDFRKQMILMSNILLLADYEGSKIRKGRKPKFGEILDEFMKAYRKLLDSSK